MWALPKKVDFRYNLSPLHSRGILSIVWVFMLLTISCRIISKVIGSLLRNTNEVDTASLRNTTFCRNDYLTGIYFGVLQLKIKRLWAKNCITKFLERNHDSIKVSPMNIGDGFNFDCAKNFENSLLNSKRLLNLSINLEIPFCYSTT